MRSSVLVSVVAVSLLVAPLVPQSNAQITEALVTALAGKVAGLWDNGQLELLGNYCNYNVRPTIKKFQLYFNGSMYCPGWTTIRGEASTRSRSGVVGETTKDFIRKAMAAGLITQQQATDFLKT
nr:anti-lipopolysaccharide factor-like [Cherax quadricarinatus]